MRDNSAAAGPQPRELVRNDYCLVSFDSATRIARFVRTATAVRTLEEADRLFGEAINAITSLDRDKIRLVIDLREAPMRNDPLFEVAMAEHRRQVARGVRKVAVIVKTAVGKLHAQRLGKRDVIEQHICSSEDEALAFLGG